MAARHVRLLILGSGPAGCTAAIYGARAGLGPVLLEGLEPGGQLSITTEVENYPGFAEPVQGPWLMEQMRRQAANCGAELVSDLASEVDLRVRPFRLVTDGGLVFTCDALVIATGATARWLGLESERRFRGHGVSACATCDGFFFRGRPVAVIGGGNTAVEEALYLAGLCEKVWLVHRRDRLRAEKVLQERLFRHPKVEVVWDHVVDEILGEDRPAPHVTGLRLRHVHSGARRELRVDGVFIAIGHEPATALFRGQLEMDDQGYIVTAPDSTRTSVPGVFAAGDVQDRVFRQAVTAAGTGCMAAFEAEKYLMALEH
ncbi:Thioredoxin reductase [bacterium HR40]|nr:Thioredoxin reductase [bacterium HR40]